MTIWLSHRAAPASAGASAPGVASPTSDPVKSQAGGAGTRLHSSGAPQPDGVGWPNREPQPRPNETAQVRPREYRAKLHRRAVALRALTPSQLRAAIADQLAHLHAEGSPSALPPRVAAGTALSVDVRLVVSGQRRLAYGLVRAYLDSFSSRGRDFRAPAVITPEGKVLIIDKNHHCAAAIALGYTEVPVSIVADCRGPAKPSRADHAAFLRLAVQRGWAYPATVPGAARPEGARGAYWDHGHLQEDPYRLLVALAAVRAQRTRSGRLRKKGAGSLALKAWVKITGVSVNHVEFKLADVLYRMAATDEVLADSLALPPRRRYLRTSLPAIRSALERAVASGELDPKALGIELAV